MGEKKTILWSTLQKTMMMVNGVIIVTILIIECLKICLPPYILICMVIAMFITVLSDIMLKEYKYLYTNFIMTLALCTNVIMYMLNF